MRERACTISSFGACYTWYNIFLFAQSCDVVTNFFVLSMLSRSFPWTIEELRLLVLYSTYKNNIGRSMNYMIRHACRYSTCTCSCHDSNVSDTFQIPRCASMQLGQMLHKSTYVLYTFRYSIQWVFYTLGTTCYIHWYWGIKTVLQNSYIYMYTCMCTCTIVYTP